MILLALSTALAFITGFAIKRGNICAVAATQQWVAHKKSFHLRAFVSGMCSSGIVLLSIAWACPGTASVSPEFPITFMTVSGGVVFGLGAWLNKGCVLGTIAFLSRGDMNYAGTIIGMFLGAFIGQNGYRPTQLSIESPLKTPTAFAVSIACLYVFLLFYEVWLYRQRRNRSARTATPHDSHELLPMILVVGGCCGALHALNGEWTYLATLTRLAERLSATTVDKPLAAIVVYSFATFAGGFFAAWHTGELKTLTLKPRTTLHRFLGGTAMGFGACLIPAGNESMMFYGVPSLAFHAIIAYAAMTFTLLFASFLDHKVIKRCEK